MLLDDFLVDAVHHLLESAWRICEAEKHYQWFPMSELGFERRLPLVSFFNPYVIVALSYVKFGK
jgi:hypothetical protein